MHISTQLHIAEAAELACPLRGVSKESETTCQYCAWCHGSRSWYQKLDISISISINKFSLLYMMRAQRHQPALVNPLRLRLWYCYLFTVSPSSVFLPDTRFCFGERFPIYCINLVIFGKPAHISVKLSSLSSFHNCPQLISIIYDMDDWKLKARAVVRLNKRRNVLVS